MTSLQIDISALTTAEKILLAEELWESARADTENTPVSQEVAAELQRRFALEKAGGMEYYSWEEVKARLPDKLPPKE